MDRWSQAKLTCFSPKPNTDGSSLCFSQNNSGKKTDLLGSTSIAPALPTSNRKTKKKKNLNQGFPGGAVVENPSANAGDTGSIPGPGGSRMPQSSWARVPQLLSLHSRACEPQLVSPRAAAAKAHAPGARAPQWERPPQWKACAPRRGVAPACRN